MRAKELCAKLSCNFKAASILGLWNREVVSYGESAWNSGVWSLFLGYWDMSLVFRYNPGKSGSVGRYALVYPAKQPNKAWLLIITESSCALSGFPLFYENKTPWVFHISLRVHEPFKQRYWGVSKSNNLLIHILTTCMHIHMASLLPLQPSFPYHYTKSCVNNIIIDTRDTQHFQTGVVSGHSNTLIILWFPE